MTTKVFCTLGPASLDASTIHRLEELGASLFRINLSYSAMGGVEGIFEFVRRNSSVPLCIDTEGARVRYRAVAAGVILEKGRADRLTSDTMLGADVLVPRSALSASRDGRADSPQDWPPVQEAASHHQSGQPRKRLSRER